MKYKKISGITVLVALILTGAVTYYSSQTSDNIFQAIKTQIVGDEIFLFTNEQRSENKRPSLTFNSQLMEAAQNRAEDMAQKSYFSHTSPDGRKFEEWVKDAGYNYAYVAENLAVKFLYSKSVVSAWMNSDKHRNTILSDRYTEIGIGIALGEYKDTPALFVAAIFGEPTIPKEIRDQLLTQ